MTDTLLSISHQALKVASGSLISFKDLTTYLSLTRIVIPWVTGFPYLAFLVWHFLGEEIDAYLTQGQKIGLFDWNSSDSSALNSLILLGGSLPSLVYLATYLLGLPASLYFLWATNQASLDSLREDLAKILLILSSVVYALLGTLSLGGILFLVT